MHKRYDHVEAAARCYGTYSNTSVFVQSATSVFLQKYKLSFQ